MAESPAHRFGQIIGDFLESLVEPQLERYCSSQGLYLDHRRRHRSIRRSHKLTWQDDYGNSHDLDFVLERDGTDAILGRPVGFIEVAWRRYTKHSRNKVQEIQGAILPLAEKYKWNNPFLGAVLAGDFTSGSLEQLKSLGFNVLYFPYETMVEAFASEAIDINFDENTSDTVFHDAANQIETAPSAMLDRIATHLLRTNQKAVDDFYDALGKRLGRRVTRVLVIPLYGRINEFASLEDAARFLDQHFIYEGSGEFRKYEVQVEFSNDDKLQASLNSKAAVLDFLGFVAKQ